MRSARPRRRLVGVALAVLLAVAVAVGTGYSDFRSRTPGDGTVTSGVVGEPVRVGERTFTVTSFEAATRFPAAEADEEPVTAMPGAVLVLVVLRTDHGPLDPTTSYCDVELVDLRDDTVVRTWRDTDPFRYSVAAPEGYSCLGESPTERVTEMAAGFQVPADAVPHLALRVGQEGAWAQIRR
ncbi:hypothetical protein ACQBAU_05055 [Propionibacteriaceae bacterium Y2011]